MRVGIVRLNASHGLEEFWPGETWVTKMHVAGPVAPASPARRSGETATRSVRSALSTDVK
jgi:hypothetical protein